MAVCSRSRAGVVKAKEEEEVEMETEGNERQEIEDDLPLSLQPNGLIGGA